MTNIKTIKLGTFPKITTTNKKVINIDATSYAPPALVDLSTMICYIHTTEYKKDYVQVIAFPVKIEGGVYKPLMNKIDTAFKHNWDEINSERVFVPTNDGTGMRKFADFVDRVEVNEILKYFK